MITDSFFLQGKSHKVCQDYAIHGKDYVILADGCSTAKDSDFGARLLAKAAQSVIEDGWKIDDEGYKQILYRAKNYLDKLELSNDCLCATLSIVQSIEEYFYISIFGDGSLAVKDLKGNTSIYTVEFPLNAPFYLRYLLEHQLINDYQNNIGNYYTINEFILGEEQEAFQDIFNIDFNNPINTYLFQQFAHKDIATIALFTDGISSFYSCENRETSKQITKIEASPIIEELLTFKNFNPGFVERRCQAAMRKFNKLGWFNSDDLSMGVIYND